MKQLLRVWVTVAIIVWSVTSASAQVLPPGSQQIKAVSSGVTDCVAQSNCAVWSLPQTTAGSVTIQITGTATSLTLTFEGSVDGLSWASIQVAKLSTGALSTTTTSTGQYAVMNSGFNQVRVRCTTYSSGAVSLVAAIGKATLGIIGTGGATQGAQFWVAVADASLPNAKVLGALSSGLVFNTTTTGVPSVVVCGTTGTVLIGGTPPTCSATPTVDSLTGSGGQVLTMTTANVTTLSNSTTNQRFVLGLASTLYPALVRSSTTLKVRLGDDSADAPLTAAAITGSGQISSTVGGSAAFLNQPATVTAAAIYRTTSSGNNTYLGSEASVGGSTLSGSTSYATILGNASNVPIEFFVNNTKVGAFTTAAFNSVNKYQINGTDGVSCSSAGVVTSVLGLVTVCSAPTPDMWAGSGLHILTQQEYADFVQMRSAWKFGARQ